MLRHPATPQDLAAWRKTQAQNKDRIRPGRKSGEEVKAYLLARYPLTENASARARRVVEQNVLGNAPLAARLTGGAKPDPWCAIVLREGAGLSLYAAQDALYDGMEIFVGVDRTTGYFHVEGSDLLWDELFSFRGLDEEDLENPYLVSEYVACRKRFGLEP